MEAVGPPDSGHTFFAEPVEALMTGISTSLTSSFSRDFYQRSMSSSDSAMA